MARPEYSSTVLQLASDTSYAAQGDTFDGTPTKDTPALAIITQASRPARQMAAQVRNWIDREVVKILSGLIADTGILQANDSNESNGTRLTVVAGQSIPTADVVGATTLYLARHTSTVLWLKDLGGDWNLRFGAGASLALSGLTAGLIYDVFAYWDGSAVQLALGTAWANDSTPNALIFTGNGNIAVQGASTSLLSRRYVGSIRATSATTTEDSASKRFVYNAANKVRRHLFVSEATASWSYASTTFVQVRGQTSNKVEFIARGPTPVSAFSTLLAQSSASGVRPIAGIGVNSTTVNSGTTFGDASSTNFATETNQTRCEYDAVISDGYYALNWLQAINSATSTTIYGTTGGSTSSLRAHLMM